MRKTFILACICYIFSCIHANSTSDTLQLYVSSQNDNSANHFTSLQEAYDNALKIRDKNNSNIPVLINVSAGTHNISKPLNFYSNKNDSPIIIRGEGMFKTIISGGITLPKFKQAAKDLWTIDMSELMPSGGEIQQLYVNGKRAIRARTPNENTLFKTMTAKETVIDSVPPRAGFGLGAQSLRMPDEAIKALDNLQNKNFDQLKISVLHAWDITRRYVSSYSKKDSSIYIVGGLMKPWNSMDRTSQFMLEDDRSFLDAPGEWFYDANEAKLYYIPRDGEKIDESIAIMPSAKQLLILKGDENNHISNITFEDLSFQYTRYTMSWRGNEPAQAAAPTDAAVMADFASDITFNNCEIAHTGNNAVWLKEGCQNCNITNCYFHDLGIGAVKIGTMEIPANEDKNLTKHITVDNNIFHSGSRVFPTGVGITIFQASDNTITHNEIADFYYSGISVGWLWGYAHSPSKRNKILYNHIHHIGWGILSDMGGVYTLGPSEGTEVSNNVIHNIYSYGYGGWGLYTDEGSTGITMENNLVYNCKSSGFHQHYGKENIIRNNIFVDQLKAQLEAKRIEEHLSFSFTNNIIYYEKANMYGINWDKANSNVDYNCYWNGKGDVSFNGVEIKEWQSKTGKDRHSIIANPSFADIKNGDFKIKNSKVIKKIKFKPFDYTKAGVYGDEAWKKLAELPKDRIDAYDEIVSSYESKQ